MIRSLPLPVLTRCAKQRQGGRAERIQSSIAGQIKLRNTLRLRSDELFGGRFTESKLVSFLEVPFPTVHPQEFFEAIITHESSVAEEARSGGFGLLQLVVGLPYSCAHWRER